MDKTELISTILGILIIIPIVIAIIYGWGCINAYFLWNITNLFIVENGLKMVNFFVFRTWIVQWTYVLVVLQIVEKMFNKK